MHATRPVGLVLLLVLLAVGQMPTPISTSTVASQVDDNILVAITNPWPGQRLHGTTQITGYAADRRSVEGSGLNEQDLQIYLNDSSGSRNLLAVAQGRRPSPEAVEALGPQFRSVGFGGTGVLWQTCTFPPGSYTLIVWASSLVVPGAKNSASIDVEIEPCSQGEILQRRDADSTPLRGGSTSQGGIWADFVMGIDARVTRADPNDRIGITLREVTSLYTLDGGRVGLNMGYSFLVWPANGTFALRYWGPTNTDIDSPYIIPVTSSTAIRRGTEFNRLAVLAQGSWLGLFVNGQQISEVYHEDRPWGRIGWGGAALEFRDFAIATLGSREMLDSVIGGR